MAKNRLETPETVLARLKADLIPAQRLRFPICSECGRGLFLDEQEFGICRPCVRSGFERFGSLMGLGAIARPGDGCVGIRILPTLQPHLAGKV